MKHFTFLFVILYGLNAMAQTDLSGSYGYTLEGAGAVPKDERAVPSGRLVLVKMEGNTYRFWLDVLTKGPEFNRAETDGTLNFTNDTASFDNTFEDATGDCILKFERKEKTIVIKTKGNSFSCGFANNVHADGEYAWLPKQVKPDNDWLKTQYPHAPTLKIGAEAAELYRDQDGFQSYNPKRTMVKGDSFLSIVETEQTVYTEMIGADGTLRYGWLRKKDIKLKD